MKNLRQLFLFAITIFSLLLLAGCGGGGRSPDSMRSFMFEADRIGPATNTIGGDIYVKTFKIARPFDSSSFIYKRAANSYETDYYNRFVTSPEILITQRCRGWLEKSDIFKNVLNSSSLVSADYILEGNVISLYGDFAHEGQTFTVVQIKFFLIKETGDKPVIIFSKDYSENVEVAATGPMDIVAGYDKGLINIFSSFEKDIEALNLK